MKQWDIFQVDSNWKILSYLALSGEEQKSLSVVAKEIGISKGMASITLRDLKESGLVERIEIGNQHLYHLSKGPLILQIKRAIGLAWILSSDVLKKLIDKDPDVISIALYGSFARGDFNSESDIDVMVISSSSRTLYKGAPTEIRGRILNISTFSPGTWLKLKRENDPFYGSVSKGYVLIHGRDLM
jgi:predicted nucleotidyltransferase